MHNGFGDSTVERGFTLTELMLTVAVAATLMAIGVPVLTDVTDGTKLNEAARVIEREFQTRVCAP